MNKELEFIEIYPKINVYRNVFRDPLDFLEKSKQCAGWEKWYTFGEMLPLQEAPIKFESFPSREEYIKSRSWQENTPNDNILSTLTKELGEIFYDVTSHFLNMHRDIEFPNWVKNSASVNRYLNGSGISDNYAMNYHTDYVQNEKDIPGLKFGLTTTFYLNDDYNDGEICFKIDDKYISHKPQKGDVIVFPSVPPYYHGVRKANGNDRYMIRSFWQFDYEGSKEWLENKEKFGEDAWNKIEEKRIKEEQFMNQLHGEYHHEFFGKDNR